MRRLALVAAPVVLLLLLIVAAARTAFVTPEKQPGAVRTYFLFATDGYLRAADGTRARFYGLVGGLRNAPLVIRTDDGSVRTIAEGPPAPTAGPLTPAESALLGQAQPLGPVIWAAAGDLVEIRFKNLGGLDLAPAPEPIGLELRGMNALGQDTAVPETARLAIPAAPGDPQSGNVVAYLFSPERPGTFAYGAMSSMGDMAGMDDMGSMRSMTGQMGCMRCMSMLGSMAMSGMGNGLEQRLNGALVVYNPGDPASQVGPGSGAGGELAGEHFDQDWLMVLPTPLMPSGAAASQPQYAPWQPERIPAGQRVLLRTVNPGMLEQRVSLRSSRYDVVAYRRNPLEWSTTRMETSGWLPSNSLEGGSVRSVLVGAGEAYDFLVAFK